MDNQAFRKSFPDCCRPKGLCLCWNKSSRPRPVTDSSWSSSREGPALTGGSLFVFVDQIEVAFQQLQHLYENAAKFVYQASNMDCALSFLNR
jgi:hypothetical protein